MNNDKITIIFAEENCVVKRQEILRFGTGGVNLRLDKKTGVLQLLDNTNRVISEVDFPTEKIITNAYYDYGTQELVLEFENSPAVRVPIQNDLSNIYTTEQVDNLINSLRQELNGIIENNINNLTVRVENLENNQVTEEEVMSIVEENSEETSTFDLGTSNNYNVESDEQIPTSKAVKAMIENAINSSITSLMEAEY